MLLISSFADEVEAIQGILEDEETTDQRSSSDEEPFSALAFKIATDPLVGTLTFVRVYSGVLNSGDAVYSLQKDPKKESEECFRCMPTIEVKYQK